jgi:cell division protease FtsH
MNQVSRSTALWIVVILMIGLTYNVFETKDHRANQLTYSEFRDALEQGKVVIKDNQIAGELLEPGVVDAGGALPKGEKGKRFVTHYFANDEELVRDLRKAKIKFDVVPKDDDSWYLVLANWLPMLILLAVWIFFMRQIQVGGGKALSFGKSRARLQEEGASKWCSS